MSSTRDEPPAAPISVGPRDPGDVRAEISAVVYGYAADEWSGVERVAVDGRAIPVVESLGNVPMQEPFLEELRDADGVVSVEAERTGSVETTTRGPLPGEIVGLYVELETAVALATFAGWGWVAWYPGWLDGRDGPMSFDSAEEFVGVQG